MTTLLAFTVDQASQLSGLSRRQIRYWDNRAFFKPSYAAEKRRAFGRIYSFRDVVGLRTIAILLKQHHVTFPQLWKVAEWLLDHPEDSWASLRFYVKGRQVYFEDPDLSARRSGAQLGQLAFPFEMRPVILETEAEAAKLRQRSCDEIGRITQHRLVSHNAPVLAGTRIRTAAIWHFHESGHSDEEILRQYPRLEPADIRAAIAFERDRRQRIAS